MFPLFVDLTEQLCVVIGGGSVGRRKAKTLADQGAHVRLVCLHPQPNDWSCPNVTWLVDSYQPHHLDRARLVIAAASADVNRLVVADAKLRGVWVNAVENPEQGDCMFPSKIEHAGLTVAVSTGGKAPGVAKQVATHLQRHLDDAITEWVALVTEVREWLLANEVEESRRRALLVKLSQPTWLERIRIDGKAKVRDEIWPIVFNTASCKLT